MVNYILNPSISPEAILSTTPTAADVKIVNVSWPSSPQVAGSTVSFILRIRNDGYDADININVYDNLTNELLWGIGWSLAHGEEENVQASFIMPYRDIIPEVKVGYATVVTDSATGPGIAVIIQDITTSMTLNLNPTTVPSGGPVNFNGKLTVVDVAIDPGVQEIKIKVGADVWATVNTDGVGNYSGSFNAPQDGGGFAYAVTAQFAGSQIAAGFLGSSTANASLYVGDVPSLVIPLISALAGLGLVYLSWRK